MSRILVLSPVPTHPPNAGNRVRIANMLTALKNQGHEIHLLYLAKGQDADLKAMNNAWDGFYYKDRLRTSNVIRMTLDTIKAKCGRKTILPDKIDKYLSSFYQYTFNKITPLNIDDWYDTSLDNYIRNLKSKFRFDVFIVEYVFLSKALNNFDSETLKILDTHDVFSHRCEQFQMLNINPTFFYTTKEQEKIGINRADIIFAIQDREFEFFSKMTDKKVVIVGHMRKGKPSYELTSACLRRTLLFIGTANAANIDTMKYFASEIFPTVKSRFPDIRIMVCGAVGAAIGKRLDPAFEILDDVDDLESVYTKADVIINPVRLGTGLKIKNIEAISFGIPVVTSSIGAHGLEKEVGNALLVADTPDLFVDHLEKLLTDDKYYTQISRNALEFGDRNTKDNIKKLADLLPI